MKREARYFSNFKKSYFISFLLLVLLGCMGSSFTGCNQAKNKEGNKELLNLDALMEHSDEFKINRLKKIAELKQEGKAAKTPEQKYRNYNQLFEFYYTINADSALIYADKSIEAAKNSGNKEWITHSEINKATLLAATGLLNGALDIVKNIERSKLSEEELVEYYGQMIYIYSHLGNYEGRPDSEYYVTERMYKDSVMSVITESHPDYLWYKGWDILGTDQDSDSVIQALEKKVAGASMTDRQTAKNLYILARLYQEKNDKENFIKYMSRSAEVDVRIANSEIASLEDLARSLFDNGNGDVDHAYAYIDYSLTKALEYPNRTRALGISQTLGEITKAYQKRIEKQRHNTVVFLVLVCVLVVVLSVAVLLIVMKNKKIGRQRKDLAYINDELKGKVEELSVAEKKLNEMNKLLVELNNDLKNKNDELHEANFVKEEYIGYVFNLCSKYIAQMEDLKRNIYIKAIRKQYKDIETQTSDIDMKDELKEFYHSFDTIFLNIYPNFVNDFNSLLKPDKRIVLKDGDLLNMELRIYALVRLGISDSVKIADFLHCAPQTIYNYRLRARSRALYPKDEFLEKIKSLGAFAEN